MATFEEKYQVKLDLYAKTFRIEDLNDANDKSTLDIMLKTEVMIDDLQAQIQLLIDESPVENATNIKKLADLLRDATTTITNLQRTLAIDRRSRKTEETTSVADYIRTLKRDASEFMAARIIFVYCPTCKVMVGRVYPVHEHSAFMVSFQCDQCKKAVRARREERDIFFDIKDAAWRRKHPAQVIQPKQKRDIVAREENPEEEFVDGELEIVQHNLVDMPVHQIEDQLEIGEADGTTETIE